MWVVLSPDFSGELDLTVTGVLYQSLTKFDL